MKRVYSVFFPPYSEVGIPTFVHSRTMPKKIITMFSGKTPGSFPTSTTAFSSPLPHPPLSPLPPFSPLPPHSSPSSTRPPSHSDPVPPKDTEMSKEPVTADKFESEELVKLLEIIDKLREFGVSEDISLPQVCFLLDFFWILLDLRLQIGSAQK